MPDLHVHMADCQRFLGSPYEEVHRWLDALFPKLGPEHRHVRHHTEGAREAGEIFGSNAEKAAQIHILRDCRNLPSKLDYEVGAVDKLGMRTYWPASAFFRYSEDDFMESVGQKVFGPHGRILWSFMGDEAPLFLNSVTRLSPQEVTNLEPRWREACAARERLEPLSANVSMREWEGDEEYLKEFRSSQLWTQLQAQFGELRFMSLAVDDLIQPLVFLDGSYLDDLRAEFVGVPETGVARYAFPVNVASEVRVVVENEGRSISLLSAQRTMGFGPGHVRQNQGSMEVVFPVSNSLQIITASKLHGTFVLRTGVHRAFLLLEAGYSRIPCLVTESAVTPLTSATVYPTFTQDALTQNRPPLLKDFLNESLFVDLPLLRTRRLMQIKATESVIPVE
jgi:hypothetical protein